MAALRFDRVTKHYDLTTKAGRAARGPRPGEPARQGVDALRDIDLALDDGEAVTVVGPSGSGKTTLLRVAAGLELATRGSVHIGERDVTALPAGDRNVSMVFQTYALFPHLTVAENIGFGLKVRHVDRATAATRVQDAARIVGCGALLDRRPFELSGGERQRVALARALVREPDVLLLDEPLSNLDAQLRVEMRAELASLHRTVGRTMLYVTHDQGEALTLGQRVAVLDRGALQQVVTPDEIYWSPANRFVATFIGSPRMNVLPAVFVATTTMDGAAVRAGPFSIPVAREDVPSTGTTAVATDGGAADNPAFELGVRPEHVVLGPLHAEQIANADEPDREVGTVVLVESTGSDTFVHVDADGSRVVARVDQDVHPVVGERVVVGIAADRWYLFDRSGNTIVAPTRRERAKP
jgi:multiple sugar transport system ATP-binding protein